jgi:flagellar basal body-associated protein FliL
MKKIISILLLSVFAVCANAGLVSSNLFTLQAVTGTNSGTPIVLGSAYITPMTFFFQNTGLPTTNAFRANIKFGLSTNTSTFATVGVYVPASTNAIREAYVLTNSSITIYGMVDMITTNSLSVGADVTKQQ